MLKRKLTAGLLALALVVCAVLPVMNHASAAEAYNDFDAGAWYAEAVSAAVDNGLLRGTSERYLNPNGYLTRAEMAAIINRAFGTYKTADISQFLDVKKSAWYYEDLQKAVQMGTYKGNGNHTLTPDASITRQEVMTVMARALCLDLDRYSKISLTHFTDSAEVSIWAIPYVRAMVGAGYVSGRGNNELAPVDKITRAEFAQLFYNAIGSYITEEGTYKSSVRSSMLVRTPDVKLEGMAVNGDLYIGSGVGDGEVYLSNVTVNGRIVVWGGGTNSVYLENTSTTEELVVCRVDGPVRVVFDEASTKAVKEVISVGITEQAASFEDTEVVFWEDTETETEPTPTPPVTVIPTPEVPDPTPDPVVYSATIVDVLGNTVTGFDIESGDSSATITLPTMSKVIPMIITISANGSTQSGVSVTLKANDGTTLGTGTTNSSGKVILPQTTSDLSDEEGSIIIVSDMDIYKVTVKNKSTGTPLIGAKASIDASKLITVALPTGADDTIALITVTDEKNNPYSNHPVALTTSSGTAKGSGQTNTLGQIVLPNESSNPTDDDGWAIIIDKEGNIYKIRVQDKLTLANLKGAMVSIDDTKAIKVCLPSGKDDAIALITVLDENDAPRTALSVTLATNSGLYKDSGTTDSNGQVVLPKSDTNPTDSDGWAVIIGSDGSIYKVRVQNKNTLSGIANAVVSVDSSKAIKVVLPTGEDETVTLITVLNESDAPRVGVSVSLETNSGDDKGNASTDSNGQVVLPVVNPYVEELNQQVANSQISVSLSADMLATVGSKEVKVDASNNSTADTYVIEIRRKDTGALICGPITLTAGAAINSITLYDALPYGNYECSATITATRNGNPLGTLKLTTTVYVAYLWAT